jgi:hypothetical protein
MVETKIALLGIICLCLILFVSIIILIPERQTVHYVAFYPYSNGMHQLNKTRFSELCQIAEETGFSGVLLWNIECFFDEKLVTFALEECASHNLKVLIPLRYFDRSYSFPFVNETYDYDTFFTSQKVVELYCEFLSNVSKLAVQEPNFSGWIYYYPYNETYQEQLNSSDYERRVQDCILSINEGKPVYVGAELWGGAHSIELYEMLPKDLIGVHGAVIQVYNFEIDAIPYDFIRQNADYWESHFDSVMVGEWGVCTSNKLYSHGLASSESKKAQMVADYLEFFYDWDCIACYFGLEDFDPEGDFGLINSSTYALNEGGKNFKTVLN